MGRGKLPSHPLILPASEAILKDLKSQIFLESHPPDPPPPLLPAPDSPPKLKILDKPELVRN